MSVSPRDRHKLHTTLAERLGPDEADTMMELLPHNPPDELVTISYFQTEMAAYRAQSHAEFTEFRTEVKGDLLRVENQLTLRIASLESAMARTHSSMMRWLVALAGVNIVTAATVIGA